MQAFRLLVLVALFSFLLVGCNEECAECTLTETVTYSNSPFDSQTFESDGRYCDDRLEDLQARNGAVQVDSTDPDRVRTATLEVVCEAVD